MKTIDVLYFAICRERTGCTRETVRVPAAATVEQLVGHLVELHPALDGLQRFCRYAVNEDFVRKGHPLADGDIVALIPPVAGGAPQRFAILEKPLSVDEVRDVVSRPEAGSVVIFEGVVRNHSKGKSIDHLEYEAYTGMAEKKLAQIGDEVTERWPEAQIAVHHRVGSLAIGECAVVIAVSSAHRKESFLACEYAIDRIKEILPVWKKEFTTDGEYWVGLGS